MDQRATVTMSMRELDRLKLLQAVVAGELPAIRAAERLSMSTRQIRRLTQRYRLEGPVGLISRARNRHRAAQEASQYRNPDLSADRSDRFYGAVAAGALRGRKATTHWAAFELLHYFGAIPVNTRVVIDRNIVSAAGITSGIDGALTLAALLRGDTVAQEIQLDIQYAPEPPFHAGSPDTAPQDVLNAVMAKYQPLTEARERTARRIASRFGS